VAKASINILPMKPELHDGLNFASKMTPARAWNAFKLVSSYFYSRLTKVPVNWGLPVSVAFEPTTSCNLRCPECPSGLRAFTRPTGMLDQKLFTETIEDIHQFTSYLTFYFQGEPYLNPSFLDMVSVASRKRIYTTTSTNAHYLNEENARKTVESGLDRLIISIDGTDQATYENYRKGGQLDKVKEGTRNIIKWKKQLKSRTPYVIFQFLVVKPNQHQIEDVKILASEMGVDKVKFKTAQVYDYKHGNVLIPTIGKYARYEQLPDDTYAVKNKLLDHCWKMWHSCVITWDGKVVPCCFDKDASHMLGSVKDHSLREIWRSPEYVAFRKSLLKSRSEIDICANCTEGTKVWA